MRTPIFFSLAILLLLSSSAISPSAKPVQKVVTAGQVNGTWRWQRNTFKVLALGKQKLRLEFQGTYEYKSPAGKMANTGTASGTVTIEGDTAFFKPSDADEQCKISLRFTRGKLLVTQEGVCGFGNNVTAAGTYRKINRNKPKFDKE